MKNPLYLILYSEFGRRFSYKPLSEFKMDAKALENLGA
jgi:hypothetical protein